MLPSICCVFLEIATVNARPHFLMGINDVTYMHVP
jgi:hypothetical protein